MTLSFFYSIDTWILSTLQLILMLSCIKLGQWVAKLTTKDISENTGSSAITTAVYGLLALLLAFTFGMSGDRFKTRKQIIVQEANAISTAVLRTKLYADSVHEDFYKNFRPYLEARIHFFAAGTDTVQIREALQRTEHYQQELWKIAADNSRIPSNLVASNQMVPALNAMFDIATERFWAEYNRTPASILSMLFILSFATAFVAGYTSVGKGKFDWFLATGFCLFTSLVIFFIIDLDKPRKGVITMDQAQSALLELRRMFKE